LLKTENFFKNIVFKRALTCQKEFSEPINLELIMILSIKYSCCLVEKTITFYRNFCILFYKGNYEICSLASINPVIFIRVWSVQGSIVENYNMEYTWL